ncbi:hypothetical protein AcW1_002415 [Taiwanofungus camphoratus]|nr:hypothetical protein AcW1_002415 [Antrodia cinnamomea]
MTSTRILTTPFTTIFSTPSSTHILYLTASSPLPPPSPSVSSSHHFVIFSRPCPFPSVLDLGLRVNKLGTSSVGYEVGVFEEGQDVPSAVGGYTHVFTDSVSRRSAPITQETRKGLAKLLVSGSEPRDAKL